MDTGQAGREGRLLSPLPTAGGTKNNTKKQRAETNERTRDITCAYSLHPDHTTSSPAAKTAKEGKESGRQDGNKQRLSLSTVGLRRAEKANQRNSPSHQVRIALVREKEKEPVRDAPRKKKGRKKEKPFALSSRVWSSITAYNKKKEKSANGGNKAV
mmetsp:Transcript_40926/g.80690  ORF Transcript_40926/g.80690 Transcript_40926/m.80690 type:complete len:157 (+) Transcript_40926:1141-1611(+)